MAEKKPLNHLNESINSYVSLETQRRIEGLGFAFHFIPEKDLTSEISSGRIPLNSWLLDHVEEGTVEKNAVILKQRLIAIDTRARPNFQDGYQMYADDKNFLGPLLNAIREEGKAPREVEYGAGKVTMPEKSRFGFSFHEIKDLVIPRAAGKFSIKHTIRVPRISEFLYLANEFYPQWLSEGTREWCEDFYFDSREGVTIGRLFAGPQEEEKITVRWWWPHGRLPSLGFRLVIAFS